METRLLGANGPSVSAIGLGCMGMSDFYGTHATRDDAESRATIEAALEAGVTLLDTGDFYGNGHNEMLLGDVLAGRNRTQTFLSVKFGALRTPAGSFGGIDGRQAAVKNFAAYSLQRLRVAQIDLYQPARIDPAVPIEETVGAVADLIQEGRVRYLGLSEVTADQIRRAHKVHPVAAVQIEYSLATRFVESAILPTCRELGIALVAYGALSRGLLTAALPPHFAPADFRAHLPRFAPEQQAHNGTTVAAFVEIAKHIGATPAQLAIAWTMAQGKDIVPVVGISKRARLAENLAAATLVLDSSTRAALDSLFAPGAIRGERYPAAQSALIAH
jgi:aryl-alcohol dehydrogenase-like predicted oxidoreductase